MSFGGLLGVDVVSGKGWAHDGEYEDDEGFKTTTADLDVKR
jgi:hypothetical protein